MAPIDWSVVVTIALSGTVFKSGARDRYSGAMGLFICLSVVSPSVAKMQKRDLKLSNLELWSVLTTYRKSDMGFSKNPLLYPKNPRWRRSAVLKIDMTSFFSAVGGTIWIKFCRLVQIDMLTGVIWSNGNQK